MDPTAISVAAALVVALACLVTYHVSLAREEHQILRETSRFPLFAARDELVGLVAAGQISEDDAAWSNVYRAVCSHLGMHQQLHLLDILSRCAKHVSQLETDAEYRKFYQTMIDTEEKVSAQNPAFASACESVDRAFVYLVRKRTRSIHVILIVFVVVAAMALFTLVTAGTAAAKGVMHVIRVIRKPEGPGIKYFPVPVPC